MATPSCSTCDAPNATLLCGVCGEFAFCSMQCSDNLAEGHYRVCYDKDSHVQPILEALGMQIGDAATIDSYLEHSDFTPAALAAIGGLFGRKKKPSKKRSKKGGNRKRAHKKQGLFHRKKIEKYQAVLDDANASTRAKSKAQKKLARHQTRAQYHEEITAQ